VVKDETIKKYMGTDETLLNPSGLIIFSGRVIHQKMYNIGFKG
jgi:hypothetical protein